MVRISKQSEKRSVSRRRPKAPAQKTGSRKDHLPSGFKTHQNALEGDSAATAFIPKIK
jgi:hypothetical protein